MVARLQAAGVEHIENAFSLETAARLTEAAKQLTYTEQPKKYGKRQVRQELASTALAPGGLLWHFADTVEERLRDFFGPEVFATPLAFNARNIQSYQPGSLGIEPHRDESHNHNLVVLVTLSGSGRLVVYQDLGGPIQSWHTLSPGSLLLMAAPGFMGRNHRPVHSVDHIEGERYLMGLRQHELKGGAR